MTCGMTWRTLLVLTLTTAGADLLVAQAVTPVAALRPEQAVRFSLRAAVRAQEAYQLDNTRYAQDVSKLRFQSEPGVTVTVLLATQRGWVGQATHSAKPGRTCVVYFGQVDPSFRMLTEFEGRRPKREGEPVCDSF